MYRYTTTRCNCRFNKPKDNDDSRHFIVKGTHSHGPDVRVVNKAKSMNQLKVLAKETRIPVPEVNWMSIANVSNATAAMIAGPKQLTQMVNRARLDRNAPKNPKKLSELCFSEQRSKTENGEEFILWDSGCDEAECTDRTIMFGTTDNVNFLAQCTHWFMDGTFKSSPHLFTQLYTIHGKYYSLVCFIFIVSNKSHHIHTQTQH